MKRIDWTIIGGFLIGLTAITAGVLFEGLNAAFLWNPTAAMIVGGGTLGAIIVRRGFSGIASAVSAVLNLRNPDDDREQHRVNLARLAWLARAARKNGPKTYEGLANQIDDALLSNGLLLLAENAPRERMQEAFTTGIEREYADALRDVQTIEAAGGFAPTFGILGAVIGLISVLRLIDEPAALGAGIAAAFVATIYGIGAANLLFFPLASRLREQTEKHISRREELAAAMLSLLDKETPRAIINQFNLMK